MQPFASTNFDAATRRAIATPTAPRIQHPERRRRGRRLGVLAAALGLR